MLVVYKYPIPDNPLRDYFVLELPQGAKLLTIQTQHEKPTMWALVNPKAPKELRQFRLAGTGHPIEELEESLHFIGTFQLMGGNFIGHLFELKA